MTTQLSKNFTLSEFTRSKTAIQYGIDNTPTTEEIANMKLLCENVLEPIRKLFKRPIKITSGYRSKQLNLKVGGVSNSQHKTGQAADIQISGIPVDEAFNKILESGIEFDQCILESTWLHLSYNQGHNRNQALIAIWVNGKFIYEPAERSNKEIDDESTKPEK